MSGIPENIKRKLTQPLPSNVIKERDGGGNKKLSYISGSVVIDILNSAFDYMWEWETLKEWVSPSEPFLNKFNKNEHLEIGYNAKGEACRIEPQGPVAHVKGVLTVYWFDEKGELVSLRKLGYGSKSVLGKQNDQESIFKAAGTDALKKAASLLGVGLELYRDEDEQAFFDELSYEDPWTEEAKETYSVERQYLTDFLTKYKKEYEDLGDYVQKWSEGGFTSAYDIVPDNIASFVEYLKATEEAVKNKVKK